MKKYLHIGAWCISMVHIDGVYRWRISLVYLDKAYSRLLLRLIARYDTRYKKSASPVQNQIIISLHIFSPLDFQFHFQTLSRIVIYRNFIMQQISHITPHTPSSSMSSLPPEILSLILLYTMRSEKPVHLQHFVQLGRRLQKIRNGNDAKNLEARSREAKNPSSKSSGSACSESWFLDHVDPGQREHFQDWLLINSTCHSFRVWGKAAFFSEKIFIIRPRFLRALCGWRAESISPEIIPMARTYIHHVIAPLSYTGRQSERHHSLDCRFNTLPYYQFLQGLCKLSIQTECTDSEMFSRLEEAPLKRYPLPEKLSSLLRDTGLAVHELKMDIQSDKEHPDLMKDLARYVYPSLETLLLWQK